MNAPAAIAPPPVAPPPAAPAPVATIQPITPAPVVSAPVVSAPPVSPAPPQVARAPAEQPPPDAPRGPVHAVFSAFSNVIGHAANATGKTVNWVIDLPGKAISAGDRVINGPSSPPPPARLGDEG
jgi:hypothetical protein